MEVFVNLKRSFAVIFKQNPLFSQNLAQLGFPTLLFRASNSSLFLILSCEAIPNVFEPAPILTGSNELAAIPDGSQGGMGSPQ